MELLFESKHFYFRNMNRGDVASLRRVVHQRDGSPCDEDYASLWIRWCMGSYVTHGFAQYAVVDKESGELVGSAGISMQKIDGEELPEIGYHLRSDYQGQGLGKEAVLVIRDYFFTCFDYDEVFSYMDEDNVASYKTAESMGMSLRKTYVDEEGKTLRVYSITRSEWQNLL